MNVAAATRCGGMNWGAMPKPETRMIRRGDPRRAGTSGYLSRLRYGGRVHGNRQFRDSFKIKLTSRLGCAVRSRGVKDF
jgi:hypothetical protein